MSNKRLATVDPNRFSNLFPSSFRLGSPRSRFGIGRDRVNIECGYTIWKKVINTKDMRMLVNYEIANYKHLSRCCSNNAFLS